MGRIGRAITTNHLVLSAIRWIDAEAGRKELTAANADRVGWLRILPFHRRRVFLRALECGIFDDQVAVPFVEDEILRYFTDIVAKYSAMVQKAIAKVSGLGIAVVASAHGIVRRSNRESIGLANRP